MTAFLASIFAYANPPLFLSVKVEKKKTKSFYAAKIVSEDTDWRQEESLPAISSCIVNGHFLKYRRKLPKISETPCFSGSLNSFTRCEARVSVFRT